MSRLSLALLPFIFLGITSHAASDDIMSREEWSRKLLLELPIEFCEADDYVDVCYQVKPHECRVDVRKFTQSCLPKLSAPDKIHVFGDGITLSSKIGSCVSRELHKAHKDQLKSDNDCRDPKRWM